MRSPRLLSALLLVPLASLAPVSACGSDDDADNNASPGSGGADASSGAGGLGRGAGGGTSGGGGAAASGASTSEDASVACGNGVVEPSEECDTAIPDGTAGACPTSCEATTACAQSSLVGAGCEARCQTSPVTSSRDGDGCCPAGADANTDSDCTPSCGNGAVESGEGCDTGIQAGPGACETTASCDDGIACTDNAVTGDGTCNAACDFGQAVLPNATTTDGCCPQGATFATDADCDPLCGNGTVDTNEACDWAIAQGNPGACIVSCPDVDSDPCTREPLNLDSPCNPVCGSATITSPANGDGCCPSGGTANSRNDTDCVPTAFRITTLTLMDPHLVAGAACTDITATVNADVIAPEFRDDAGGLPDGGPDGLYDLSFVGVIDPLAQTGSSTFRLYTDAECSLPVGDAGPGGSVCGVGALSPQSITYDNRGSGTCLGPAAGTVHPWTPPVQASTAGADGCFVTRGSDLVVSIGGLTFEFKEAQIAGQWVGDPADGVAEGLIKGFLPKSVGDGLMINFGGNMIPFGTLIVGGQGNDCANPSLSDLDTLAIGDGGTIDGWWFYLNFEAVRVPWTG